MIKQTSLFLLVLMFFNYNLWAQETVPIPFSASDWVIEGDYELGFYQGKESLWLKGGTARLPEVKFKNGIIEYDVAFPANRGFFGLHFRITEPKNYEEYYMRAHQSGNPDAMQYTPVYNGISGWQLYHGPGHSKAHKWRYNEWMHLKFVINDQQMEVYIDDMETPAFHAFELKQAAAAGYLGVYNFLASPRFANFSYQKVDNPEIKSAAPKLPPMPAGTVMNWEVSEGFNASKLQAETWLSEEMSVQRSWKKYPVEYTGTVNLAQRSGTTDEINTVLARFTIESKREQIKQLDFGYSDIARVYVNGTLVYSGQRQFRTRDYRYLGTIGYFDAVYLALKPGKNVITFAVSEQMGGWGLRAKLTDLEGVEIR
ncbi:MAG: hypothetical protein AAF927_13030 [Bacteroidota bacterium]